MYPALSPGFTIVFGSFFDFFVMNWLINYELLLLIRGFVSTLWRTGSVGTCAMKSG
jgi:hypothetical protein